MMERKATPFEHSVSALVAGVVATTLSHPLDLVKARFQVQHVNRQMGGEIQYRSTLQAFRLILRTEGLAGLYRGVVPNICGNGAAWGLYMLCYAWLKDNVGKGGTSNDPISLRALSLAAAAGAFSSVLTNPIWLVKVRLQSQPHDAADKYENMRHAVRTIYREEGMRGFWRGIAPALIGTSHGAVQMVVYEKLRALVWDRVADVTPIHYLLLGIMSKSVASVATFPYQLVKTRMQVRDLHFHRHSTLRETVKAIWKTEGPRGFYRGVVPATVKTAPHAALMFSTYEAVRSWISATKM